MFLVRYECFYFFVNNFTLHLGFAATNFDTGHLEQATPLVLKLNQDTHVTPTFLLRSKIFYSVVEWSK